MIRAVLIEAVPRIAARLRLPRIVVDRGLVVVEVKVAIKVADRYPHRVLSFVGLEAKGGVLEGSVTLISKETTCSKIPGDEKVRPTILVDICES